MQAQGCDSMLKWHALVAWEALAPQKSTSAYRFLFNSLQFTLAYFANVTKPVLLKKTNKNINIAYIVRAQEKSQYTNDKENMRPPGCSCDMHVRWNTRDKQDKY